MTARYFALLVGLAFVVVSSFSACTGPSRQFVSTDDSGGAPATGGSAGTAGSGATCSVDEERCEGLVPQRCSEAGEWVPTRASCAVACLAGQCVACTENATTCKDGAVQKCVAGAWTTMQVCPKVCQVDACVDTCTEDLYQCNGTRSLQKCVGGNFIDDTECEFSCINGECAGECETDTRRCNPEAPNESQACNAQGNWGASAPCATDTFCVAGDCKSCSPDTTRCSPSGPQLCSEDGEWVNQGACTGTTAACFEGGCVSCTPDEKRCGDNVIEKCLPDGSGWEAVETCSGDTPACLDATKTCGRCAENEAQCLDDGVQTCDDQGVFQPTKTCEGSTPQCFDDDCTQCDPDAAERRCSGTSATESCNPDGTWAPASPCTGDTPQCRPDLGFNCGCEESARRCRSNTTTVPEQCQGGAWVAQTACSGTLNYCLPATGQCVDCVPGSAECRSGVAYQCNSAGAFQSLNSCSGPGINCGNCGVGEACSLSSECRTGICLTGRCVVCQPGARDCVGTMPRLCSTDGVWTNQTNCSGATPECLPSTGQCVACSNGASRSCGSCNTGTQTCSNNQWSACTGAADLNTSEQYCGSCTNSCSSSQVCENGACFVNCGNLTRCGTSCVNLSTDTSNCLSCGTRCTPPAANGSAVCTASGCDISCTNTRCGTSCCGAPPAGSTAGCSGNTCSFTCSSGNHGCGGSSPPCYANTDATHCGASCLNCGAYVGTTGACGSNQCTCESSTSLACGTNVPTCGSWDFNSNTVEGWRFGDYRTPDEHHWVGSLGTATTNGSPALTARFDGVASGGGTAEFEVDLCPNGAILNLSSYKLSYDFYFLTTGGSRFSQDDMDSTDSFLSNGSSVLLGCQPFVEPGSDQWIHGECSNLPASMTNITIVFRLATGWAGSIFLDNVRFTPE